MSYYRVITLTLLLAIPFMLQSCRNDEESVQPTFKWSSYYLAGKIIPVKNPDNYSPYLLSLDDTGKGELVTVTKVYSGVYKIENNQLVFNTADREKWFTFKIENNKPTQASYEVRFKYKDDGTYEAAPVKYSATVFQDKVPTKAAYVGNEYKGDLYKSFTTSIFQKDYILSFKDGTHSYSSGTNTHIHFINYKNVAFRSEENSRKEFGVIIDGKMLTGSSDAKGFSYWGEFSKQ